MPDPVLRSASHWIQSDTGFILGRGGEVRAVREEKVFDRKIILCKIPVGSESMGQLEELMEGWCGWRAENGWGEWWGLRKRTRVRGHGAP